MVHHELLFFWRNLNECKLKLEHCSQDEHAFYCDEEACLCTLHLENSVSLVLIHLTLLEGHSNCEVESLFSKFGRSGSPRCKKYVEEIEARLNQNTLGAEENPSQWHFLLNESNTKCWGTSFG